MIPPRTRLLVDAVLVSAIVVDVVLPTLAFLHPAWWFDALHVGVTPDALHVALLQRAAAQWIAFTMVQVVALVRWRRETWWLLLVAGLRASDFWTDVTYFAVAPDLSVLRWVLLFPPLFNMGMSAITFGAWWKLRARGSATPA